MAREILFKAKRIDNGEWVYGNYAFCDVYTKHQHYIFQNKPLEYAIDETTLCQYTGLTDKNGNKIWENDIVRTTRKLGYMREKGEKLKVYFNKFLCHFALSFGHGEDEAFDYMTLSGKKANFMEVVGNIFDNPEILQ